MPTVDADTARRRGRYTLENDEHVPTIDDLILTKRFANRPKDLEDIRLLTILRDER
jgi:hypothetical protein